jgi:uncharacterized phage-like protein YoqJ
VRPKKVITGMALGWDTALAEAAIKLHIPYIAAIPFVGQESRWQPAQQDHYFDLLAAAEDVVVVCEGDYAPWKMQRRNEWMVDHSDLVLALWDRSPGGTANCIRYAEERGKTWLNFWGEYVA